MKYIITDQNEVRIGSNDTFHKILAESAVGRVVAAGYCEKKNGKWEVHGESIGFSLKAKPEDAEILNQVWR